MEALPVLFVINLYTFVAQLPYHKPDFHTISTSEPKCCQVVINNSSKFHQLASCVSNFRQMPITLLSREPKIHMDTWPDRRNLLGTAQQHNSCTPLDSSQHTGVLSSHFGTQNHRQIPKWAPGDSQNIPKIDKNGYPYLNALGVPVDP